MRSNFSASSPILSRIFPGVSGMGCSFLMSSAYPTAADTALAEAIPIFEPVPVQDTPSAPSGDMTAMASDVVPVSLNPCSAIATDLASTRGMNRLTFPSIVIGTDDTMPTLIVPALISSALRFDTREFSG